MQPGSDRSLNVFVRHDTLGVVLKAMIHFHLATSKWTRHDKARNSSTERKESSKQPSIPMNPFSWRHMYIYIHAYID